MQVLLAGLVEVGLLVESKYRIVSEDGYFKYISVSMVVVTAAALDFCFINLVECLLDFKSITIICNQINFNRRNKFIMAAAGCTKSIVPKECNKIAASQAKEVVANMGIKELEHMRISPN